MNGFLAMWDQALTAAIQIKSGNESSDDFDRVGGTVSRRTGHNHSKRMQTNAQGIGRRNHGGRGRRQGQEEECRY